MGTSCNPHNARRDAVERAQRKPMNTTPDGVAAALRPDPPPDPPLCHECGGDTDYCPCGGKDS